MGADLVLGFVLGFASAVLIGVIAFVAVSARHFNPRKEDQ